MLTKMPGSVKVYSSVPRVPDDKLFVPEPVTSRLMHCGYACAPFESPAAWRAIVSCLSTYFPGAMLSGMVVTHVLLLLSISSEAQT